MVMFAEILASLKAEACEEFFAKMLLLKIVSGYQPCISILMDIPCGGNEEPYDFRRRLRDLFALGSIWGFYGVGMYGVGMSRRVT